MNSDKAREHFSAYYEGTLDAGLKQQLERVLNANADLNKEYAAFAEVMRSLEVLQKPVPEPAFDLHERISQRLDLHIHEQKATQKPSWFGWLKAVGVSAIAVVAIWGAVTQLNRGGSGPTVANTGPVIRTQPPFNVSHESDNGVKVSYTSTGSKTVTVYNEDGSVLRTATNQNLDMPVNNLNPESAIVSVQVEGSDEVNIIALPGTKPEKITKTEGKLADMAKAMAAHYRAQIVIVTTEPNMMAKWALDETDVMNALKSALEGANYSCTEKSDGVIWVEKNH